MGKKLYNVPASNSVKFHCQAMGNPTPTVKWPKDGKEFKRDQRKEGFNKSTLTWIPKAGLNKKPGLNVGTLLLVFISEASITGYYQLFWHVFFSVL